MRASTSSRPHRRRSLSAFELGLAALRSFGYAPSRAKTRSRRGPLYFAGTPAQRLADLHAAFADETPAPSWRLRGGYGSNYLLDGLNLEIIAAHPKPFFAYSDLTGIQLRLLDELGLPAFHGPMLAADFFLRTVYIWRAFAPRWQASPTA